MTHLVEAWRCIGCGKIEAPQTCIGVCQDRKVEFVYAFEHEEALALLTRALARIDALEAVAFQLAWTTPRTGEWEHSYQALRQRAREVLTSSNANALRVAKGVARSMSESDRQSTSS